MSHSHTAVMDAVTLILCYLACCVVIWLRCAAAMQRINEEYRVRREQREKRFRAELRKNHEDYCAARTVNDAAFWIDCNTASDLGIIVPTEQTITRGSITHRVARDFIAVALCGAVIPPVNLDLQFQPEAYWPPDEVPQPVTCLMCLSWRRFR